MELTVSLPDEDVEFLDRYVAGQDVTSRSEAVQRAVRLLRASIPAAAHEPTSDRKTQDEDEVWDAAAISDGFD